MTWKRGDPVIDAPVVVVDVAGAATIAKPALNPGFLAELRNAASAQMTWEMAEAWLRLKTGGLAELAGGYPEVRDAFEHGRRDGLEAMRTACRAALEKASTPAGRRDKRLQRHARELRQMKRAGLF